MIFEKLIIAKNDKNQWIRFVSTVKTVVIMVGLLIFTHNQLMAQISISSATDKPWGLFGSNANTLVYTKNPFDPKGGKAIMVKSPFVETGQGLEYTFAGTLSINQTISIETQIFNPFASYVTIALNLIDLNTNTVLAQPTGFAGPDGSAVLIKGDDVDKQRIIRLNYTPTEATQGHRVMLKYIRIDNGLTCRNFGVSYMKLGDSYVDMSLQ